jgi:uncharacterized RmlC-like cupin family protein
MADAEPIRVLPNVGRRAPAGPATPGMHRLEALAEEGVWLGTVETEPGTLSGWHHHGDHETYIYVTKGAARFDMYVDRTIVRQEAPEGAFVVIPRHTVHREGSADRIEAILVRIGTGPLVFNVEGLPEGDGPPA